MSTTTLIDGCGCCCKCVGITFLFGTGNTPTTQQSGGVADEIDFNWTSPTADVTIVSPAQVLDNGWFGEGDGSQWVSVFPGTDSSGSEGTGVFYSTDFDVFALNDDTSICFRTMASSCVKSIAINLTTVWTNGGECATSEAHAWRQWNFTQLETGAFVGDQNSITIEVEVDDPVSGFRFDNQCPQSPPVLCDCTIPSVLSVQFVYTDDPVTKVLYSWLTTASLIQTDGFSTAIWRIDGMPHLIADCDSGNQDGKINIKIRDGFGFGSNVLVYSCDIEDPSGSNLQFGGKFEIPDGFLTTGIDTVTPVNCNPFGPATFGPPGTQHFADNTCTGVGDIPGHWFMEVFGPMMMAMSAPLAPVPKLPAPAKKGCGKCPKQLSGPKPRTEPAWLPEARKQGFKG